MRVFTGLLVFLCFAVTATAQDTGQQQESFRVFLDCGFFCDTQYTKDELPIVDFLNERSQADVHILHARQSTAAGGSRITLTFLGQRAYAAMSDTLVYSTNSDASRDDTRRALVHHLAIGLSRYLARAGQSDKLLISAVKPTVLEQASNSIEEDPWNYWVFSVGGSGSLDGQKSTNSISRRANFSANRTTEELKLRFSGNASNSKNEFNTGDETIESKRNSESVSAQVVKSIGGQWAVGARGSVSANSFRNAKLQMEIGPAIEYDFFPYSQSTRKFLAVQYNIKISKRRYDELTIFALDEETLLTHSLDINFSMSEKWGSVSVSTDINHMLTNFDRSLTDSYNLGVHGSANIRLFRGFSFNVFAGYSRIRDQIDLRSDAATKDEILLRLVQLPTGYSYNVHFGFTYRFGSIFNNVVNPRMGGGGGGGGMMIFM